MEYKHGVSEKIICSQCGPIKTTGNKSASVTGYSPAQEYLEAKRLATYLWEKHYKEDAPEWEPLPDMMGVLSQIDNMITGL